ncbi:MAG: AmmeMemoRadiSam system radical SAM enzyme [Halanaerobiales bacterium]
MKRNKKEAMFYEKKEDNTVQCQLCPHNCVIKDNSSGICRVRLNKDGILYSENYGELSSRGVDPIEKKPLYHFYPSRGILSLGTFGCNLMCKFCQNFRISQQTPKTTFQPPDEIIEQAKKRNIMGIAYTYSEPMVWYEYVYETAKKAHKEGLKNVLVTNGYINHKPLKKLIEYIDAANIDLKSFHNEFYKELCGGRVEPVLETIKYMEEKTHIELTTLIVTDHNDHKAELEELFEWISNLNPNIPLHLSRYFPNYKMEQPATPEKTMKAAYDLAKKYLNYVYIGNIRTTKGQNTYCPKCQTEVISRRYFNTETHLQKGKCPECGKKIIDNY